MNEEIPPEVEQVEQPVHGDQFPNVEGCNDVTVVPPKLTNREIRKALLAVASALTTHANLSMETRVNVVENTMTYRLRDFVRMNPPIFLVSRVGEDTQEF